MAEKILIVDDNDFNLRLLRSILKNEGYEIIEAVDGEEAVDLALRELPDLILLDVMMPNKDGYEACSEIKSDNRTTNIPIIFLSAKAEAEDKIKGLELGGADYVTKPFDKGEVLARVRAQLKIQNLAKSMIRANQDLLKKQESLDNDLKAAAEIQKSLLPKVLPGIQSIDVSWKFMPCQRIGGDLFNLLRLDEDHWAIYMLDVSGHGVPSAMVSVSVSQMLRPQTGYVVKKSIIPPPYYTVASPSDVLNELDMEYPIDRFEKFFTISYHVLNIKNGILKYSNAAHPPPVLLHQDGTLELLKEGGTIIGMGGILPFEEGERQLCFGDKLIIYTDGIVEYQDRKGSFYGEERFYMELQRLKDEPVSVIMDGIIESVMNFGEHNEPLDDITLLGLEFKGNEKNGAS